MNLTFIDTAILEKEDQFVIMDRSEVINGKVTNVRYDSFNLLKIVDEVRELIAYRMELDYLEQSLV